jgi:two-component system, OmpR family, heavy metal sensor histidine kinase CusS
MKWRRSIHFQLTLWYAAVLAIGMLAFGAGTWCMLRGNLLENQKGDADHRLSALAAFLSQEIRGSDLAAIREEAREYSTGLPDGHGLRVWSRDGTLLFEKPELDVPTLQRRKNVEVRGHPLRIEMRLPLTDFYRTLSTLGWVMAAVFPLVLGIAIVGGWWLANRALKPVRAMTTEARSIDSNDLTARLSVPCTGDELQDLADAWNELLERIEVSVRTVTRFTADAAHELRTPVAVIRTSAELALRQPRSPERYQQTLASIQQETEEITQLLDRLLLLARGDAGQWQFQFDTLCVDEVLRSLRNTFSSLAESKQIDVAFSTVSQPVMIRGDESAIRRLLMILADNALKYTPSGGRVGFQMQASQSSCVIEVSDTGCGIPIADLPHVFERFYRGDPARTAGMGVGLGLAIARTIVEAHHGTIEVRRSGHDGSVFRIVLPLDVPSRASSALKSFTIPR